MSAVTYAALVGKYIRMERRPDEVEYRDAQAAGIAIDEHYRVGCEGLVALVEDNPTGRTGGPCVEIVMDYGIGFPVFDDEEWVFRIWPDEATARLWNHDRPSGVRHR